MPTIGRHYHGDVRSAYPVRCVICGVPWPRSAMQPQLGGGLVCPDDYGPSAAQLDRLNARAARQRNLPKPGPDLFIEPYADPSTILGDDLHSWFRPDSLNEVDVVVDGTYVKTIRNRTANPDMIAGSSSFRPKFIHEPRAGLGAIDKLGRMTATFDSELAAGARPYFWIVVRGEAGSGTSQPLMSLSGAVLSSLFSRNSSGFYHCHQRCADGQENISSGLAVDDGMHLLETGFTSSATGKFKVDGVGYDGAFTGGLLSTATVLSLGNTNDNVWSWPVFEVVMASSVPTAAQLTAMRDYFADRYEELDIA